MALTISQQRLIKRIAIGFVTAVVVAYAGDFLWFRVRLSHPKPVDPLESWTVPRVLAIPEKGGKTSYEIDQQNPVRTITCVHSLFPQGGASPCWYVKPRANQPISM